METQEHDDEHKRVNEPRVTKFFIKSNISFCRIQIPFYRNESWEVLARICFVAVDFFDSVWRLLTFI